MLELAAALSLATATPERGIGLSVGEICQFVAENISESDPAASTRYVYQTRLFRAAGVDPARDDAATIRSKMQTYWNRHRQALVCNVPNSIVRNGSILKLAVDSSNSEFLNDVARRWKLELNQVDRDGETVLDFVTRELEKAAGSPRADTLRRYRNILESAGARRARDLPAPSSKGSP